jgi:hypothetical protein
LLVPVELLAGAELGQPIESGEVVLAHGEATGHRHRIQTGAELFALPGTLPQERVAHARKLLAELPAIDDAAVPIGIVRVGGPQELVHEEHGSIELTGDYLALRQREYHPGELRVVAD